MSWLLLFVVPALVLCSPYADNGDTYIWDALSAASPVPNAVDPRLYQLPGDNKPTYYNLTIIPFLDEGTFFGKVDINFTVLLATRELVLNSRNLTIESVSLVHVTDMDTVNVSYHVNETYERLIITSKYGFLQQGCDYQVSIVYRGLFHDDLVGFYKSSYRTGSETKWLGVTQFQATHARRAFPCFDEPAYRAVFTVNLGRFLNQSTASNMNLRSTSPPLTEFQNRVIDTYYDSPAMPTYLVAFLVGELVSVTSGDGMLTIRVREEAAYQTQYLLGIGKSVLNVVSEFVNIPYNLPKIDVIGLPDMMAGGMENWGMTTYREVYVTYEEGISSFKDKQGIDVLVSHEFAHQWFGDLVTPQWWNYTWINEAFAKYFEHQITNAIHPNWCMWQQFVINHLHIALDQDVGKAEPMTRQVYTPNQINSIFNYVIYQKGASVLRMTEHFLNTDTFRRGLNYYLTNASVDGIGTPDILFHHLDAAAKEANVLPKGLNISKILGTWTTKGGFPLLTVNRTGYDVKVSQTRYGTSDYSSAWYIPLTYTTQSQRNFTDTSAMAWLTPVTPVRSVMLQDLATREYMKKSNAISDVGWVIFNIQQTGFYRVNYDANNWKLLADQLRTDPDVIHVNNRAQLIDDAFHLAKDEYLEYSTALGLSQYLSKERKYAPWVAAMMNFNGLISLFHGTDTGKLLKSNVSSLLLPYYQYLMNDNNINEKDIHLVGLGREAVVRWACNLDIPECVDYAMKTFRQWLNNGIRIDENVKPGVLCTGLRLSGDAEWKAVWNLYLQSNSDGEKVTVLYALGCTQSELSLMKFLNHLLKHHSDIRLQDTLTVFNAVLRRQTGIAVAITYFVDNYHTLMHYIGRKMVDSMLGGISGNVIQDEHLQLIRNAVNNDRLQSELRETLETMLVFLERKKARTEKYRSAVHQWLNGTPDETDAGKSCVRNTQLSLLTIMFVILTTLLF